MTTKLEQRTDCHCPSRLIPTDYEYVGQEYMKMEGDIGVYQFLMEERARIAAHMARTGGTYSNHTHGGNCMVCGSVNAIYTVLFYHKPSNTYVRMGQECAQLVDQRAAAGLDTLRKQVVDAREYQQGVRKAQALLSAHGINDAWTLYNAAYNTLTIDERMPYEEQTIRDIVGKLVKYGSISDGQVKFVRSLLDRITNRAGLAAQRAAELATAPDAPTGRVTVIGTILSVRVDETMYGLVTKMLVKANEGYKVWGSMPAYTHGQKGDTITYKVTLKPSEKDAKFAIGSRPVLVSVEHIADKQQQQPTQPATVEEANHA